MPNPKHRRLSFLIHDELYGAVNDKLTPGERWCWMMLRAWCANSPHQPYVCCGTYTRRVGWTDRVIAESLNVPRWLWLQTKYKLRDMKAIAVSEGNVIKVNHWHKWQDRQLKRRLLDIKHRYKEMYAEDRA